MANEGVDILGLPQTVGGLTGQEWLPLVQGGTTKRTQADTLVQSALTTLFPAGIDYEINGGGVPITAGINGSGLIVPFDCTITNVAVVGEGVGSVVVDIWKCTQAQFDGGVTHPTSGDSITGSAQPTIVAGSIYTDSGLSGWTIALTEGDVLWYNIVSVATFPAITIALKARRITLE